MNKIEALDKKQQELVQSSLYVVKNVIKYHIYTDRNTIGLEYDDLFQEGCSALCRAAVSYDGSTQFSTYAGAVVKNALISYCRKISNRQKKVPFLSLDDPVSGCEDSSAAHLDTLVTSPDPVKDVSAIRLLESVKPKFSGVALLGIEALELKIKGYSGAEIAEMYGVRPNHVGAWISRAAQKLRLDDQFTAELHED